MKVIKEARVVAFRDTDGERHEVTHEVPAHVCSLGLICASQTVLKWFRTRTRFKLGGEFHTIDHRALVHVRPLTSDEKGA